MELQVIGTGSSGNCYLLRAGGAHGQALLLDAGLPFAQIIKSVKNWRNVIGCLVTHEHQDHAKSAEAIERCGIRTYATKGTIDAIRSDTRLTRFNPVSTLSSFKVGDYTLMAFDAQHDASEPCGWLIRFEPTGETALYATDTYYLRHTFPGVNYWIVECNYIESIMQEQMDSGDMPEELRGRLIKSHMSLRRLCDALEANDLTETRAIVLVHLSDERSDEKTMVETVKDISGISDVWAAEAGKTYQLGLTPF